MCLRTAYHSPRFHLSIILLGKKLKGEFALVKTKDRGDNAWLLIKKKDDAASETDITKKDKSVRTKRSLAQIAKDTGGKVKTKAAARKTKTAPLLLNESEEIPVKKKLRK